MVSMALEDVENKWTSIWSRLVARSWLDDAFRNELLAQPLQVLREHGLELSPSASLKVVPGMAPQDARLDLSAPSITLHLPDRPDSLEPRNAAQVEGQLLRKPTPSPQTWFCFC
jgi:hypothetical protein